MSRRRHICEVDYLPDEKLLLHKGKHYRMQSDFPEDANITELSLREGKLVLKFTTPSNPEEVMQNCNFEAVSPNQEQQKRLNAVIEAHGTKLTKAGEELERLAKHVIALTSEFQAQVDSICPGFDVKSLDLGNEGNMAMGIPASCAEKILPHAKYLIEGAKVLEETEIEYDLKK